MALYSGFVVVQKGTQLQVKGNAVIANSQVEAIGKLTKQGLEEYPQNDGWGIVGVDANELLIDGLIYVVNQAGYTVTKKDSTNEA